MNIEIIFQSNAPSSNNSAFKIAPEPRLPVGFSLAFPSGSLIHLTICPEVSKVSSCRTNFVCDSLPYVLYNSKMASI